MLSREKPEKSGTSKEKLREIFQAALRAADPYKAVNRHMEEIFRNYAQHNCGRLFLIGFGKAASSMSKAVADSLSGWLSRGIIITKYGHALPAHRGERITIFEAGHPLPDAKGVQATREVVRLLGQADHQTLIVCLISGGGSALLVSPDRGVTLAEKQAVTDLLMKAGGDIFELNALRKHLSAVKGGRLAQIASPAPVISLILSDVIGDRLDVIASGPTAPDPSTYQEVMEVIAKYSLTTSIPPNVRDIITRGAKGLIPETPKEGNPVFQNVENLIVGSNAMAIAAAKQAAEDLGCETEIISTTLSGEAKLVARDLASRALEVKLALSPGRKVCLLAGGETAVTVTGRGQGGRNTEMALAFALEIRDQTGITLLSAGTDGTDGPTDAAGALADGQTVARALSLGLDPHSYLADNDSYPFFKTLDDLVITGPTGTNVMDIQLILLEG
ncbi:MAG: glycerate kinase [Deltaproteobacteria bacterium]|nr:glycerate kinase [Deltaproteobacteria bacterium]